VLEVWKTWRRIELTHFPHAYNEGTDEVQASFTAALSRDFVLGQCIFTANLRNRGEKQMSTIRKPAKIGVSVK
jgi:hypothetical protein